MNSLVNTCWIIGNSLLEDVFFTILGFFKQSGQGIIHKSVKMDDWAKIMKE